MPNTTIEWTDVTWNPVRGCSLVSAGCTNCYAMRMAHRFSGPGEPYAGLTEIGPQGARWRGKIRLFPELLAAPLHWKKPRRVFVNSMSDLFHEDVPDEFIDRVFAAMAMTQRHTYQVLTKRPTRMRQYFLTCADPNKSGKIWPTRVHRHMDDFQDCGVGVRWPLSNVWLGVSVENQSTADERIPILLQMPAAVRFVSAEPLLGLVDLACAAFNGADSFGRMEGIDWVILGGESGPGARPCHVEWIRSIAQQCRKAQVPVFVKQIGSRNACPHDRKGGCWDCMPTDIKSREFPR